MALCGLQNAGIFRIVYDIDDGREPGHSRFRYGTTVDIGKHADRCAVYQDIAAARRFKSMIIDSFDADAFRKGFKVRL